MTENTAVSNNSGIVDFNHHLVTEQETRMSGSNCEETSIGSPTMNISTVSVLLSSGNDSNGTIRESAVGNDSSHNVIDSASNSSSTSAVLASFECPVCFDYVLPPILPCHNGHLICSTCRPKLNCCPLCRGSLGNIRNFAMENEASRIMFPCKYSSYGCPISLLHPEKVKHEELCECRPYTCPCPNLSCTWQGNLEQVMEHLNDVHETIPVIQNNYFIILAPDINFSTAGTWVMIQSCLGHHFMLILEKQEIYGEHQPIFAIVQLIGNREQCEKFTCRLALNGSRNLVWEGTPRSIREEISTIILNSNCLVIDSSSAQIFSDGDLGVDISIQYSSPS